ncbi:MAG TPA: MGMT family protein [Thermoanaerobaculia bacterium]|nr:MGMT family protein [Thermoanaerobaculia bacterium]
MSADDRYRRIYRVAAAIPEGRVATYGQVAHLAGLPRRARLVGRAMAELPDGSEVPWHRVVNAQGKISSRGGSPYERFQRLILEDEGVAFGPGGRIDLDRFGWDPDPHRL